jgi:hypothetical protein
MAVSFSGRVWRRVCRRNAHASVLSLLLPLLLTACDPCFGTTACVEPHISYEGRVIWHLTGKPAEGVRVQFLPSGIAGDSMDTVSALSDEQGSFVIRMNAPDDGEVRGSLVFHPPPPYEHFPFAVHGIRMTTSTVRGDARNLGLWGVGPLRVAPHISYVGEIFYTDTKKPAAGVEVEFRRTGGITVEPDTFVVRSNDAGRFPLFMTPQGEGEVTGDLLIRPPEPSRALVIRGVRLATLIGGNDIRLIGVWGIER